MAKTVRPVYPLAALRATVLHTQRLTSLARNSRRPLADQIVDLVTALGYVQVDTLHVVHRAHDLTLWSRLGRYRPADFHQLIYSDGHRRLYEGWGHAASIMPLEHYRLQRWRSDRTVSYNPAFREWVRKDANRKLMTRILERVRAEGGLRVGQFEAEGERDQSREWYQWRPSKMALEALFARGDLMVSKRVHFQRVYDVRERVLPDWVDACPVDPDQARRACLEHAAKALGVFDPRHLTLYAYMRATPARSLVRSLMEEGVVVPIQGESTAGVRTWMIHRDNLPLLERAADGDIKTERTTFLSPFDSLFWAWGRDQLLFGFQHRMEFYKPAAQRVHGYFSMPILHRDRLVGRFDPKLDRASGVLRLDALYLEPGVKPDADLVTDVAKAMRDFMAWHGAKELRVGKSKPAGFGKKLTGADLSA
jgi:uncharacterized protein YcaQ